MSNLKFDAAYDRRRVLAIADVRDVTVVALDTGEVLAGDRQVRPAPSS